MSVRDWYRQHSFVFCKAKAYYNCLERISIKYSVQWYYMLASNFGTTRITKSLNGVRHACKKRVFYVSWGFADTSDDGVPEKAQTMYEGHAKKQRVFLEWCALQEKLMSCITPFSFVIRRGWWVRWVRLNVAALVKIDDYGLLNLARLT